MLTNSSTKSGRNGYTHTRSMQNQSASSRTGKAALLLPSPFHDTSILFQWLQFSATIMAGSTWQYDMEAVQDWAHELAAGNSYTGLATALLLGMYLPSNPAVGGTTLFDCTWANILSRPRNRVFHASGQLRRRVLRRLRHIARIACRPDWERYIREKSRLGFLRIEMVQGYHTIMYAQHYADDIVVLSTR